MDEALRILNENGYTVRGLLSSGAYGACWFVKKNNEKSFAAKIYNGASDDERFQCRHENRVYSELHGDGLGADWLFKSEGLELCGRSFLLLDTFEGCTLKEYLSLPGLSVADKLEVLISACKVISNMHKRGYLHLDIKLSNFYISEESGLVRPLDMGSAVKIKKRSLDELMKEPGFISTYGFCSKRVREFNSLREKYRCRRGGNGYLISEDKADYFIKLGNSIDKRDDVFGLICCVLSAFSEGKREGFNEKIRFYAERGEVSPYMAEGLLELNAAIKKADADANEVISFESVEELVNKLEELKATEENKGITPGIIRKHAEEYYNRHFADEEIKKDLFTGVRKNGEDSRELAEPVLSGKEKNIALTGTGGSGKTTQLISLFSRLLNEGNAVPVFLNLSGFDESKNYILNLFMLEYTGRGYCETDNLKPVIRSFFLNNKEKSFIFILDSLNETSSEFTSYLYDNINFLAGFENIRVVVALRFALPSALHRFSEFKLLPISNEKLSEDIENYEGMSSGMKRLLGLPMFYRMYTESGADGKKDYERDELMEEYFEFVLSKAEAPGTGTAEGESYSGALRMLLFSFMPDYVFKALPAERSYMRVDTEISAEWEEYKRKFGIRIGKSCLKILMELGILEEIRSKGSLPSYKIKHELYFDYFMAKAFGEIVKKRRGRSLLNTVYDACRIISFYRDKGDSEQACRCGKSLFERLEGEKPLREEMPGVAYGYALCGSSVAAYDIETAKKALLISRGYIEEMGEAFRQSKPETSGILIAYEEAAADLLDFMGRDQLAKDMYESCMADCLRFPQAFSSEEKQQIKIAYICRKTGRYYLRGYFKGSPFGDGILHAAYCRYNQAYEIYKKYSEELNRNTVECINGMAAAVIPFISEGRVPFFATEKSGINPEEAAEIILHSMFEAVEYFSEEGVIPEELEKCVENISKALEVIEDKERFIAKLSKFESHDGYLLKKIKEIIKS